MGTEQDADSIDVAVIGAGYAGLSATIGLRRHRLSVLLFDGGPSRNNRAREVHGYLGAGGLSAPNLRARGRAQAEGLGAEFIRARVTRVERAGKSFELHDGDGRTYQARRLLLATGVSDRLPEIPGFGDFFGQSIHVCPHCDAYEWRDRPIAVISWTREMCDFAVKLSHWSDQVVLVSDGHQPPLSDDDRASWSGPAFVCFPPTSSGSRARKDSSMRSASPMASGWPLMRLSVVSDRTTIMNSLRPWTVG